VKGKKQANAIDIKSSCVMEYDGALRISYYSKVDKDPTYTDGLSEMSKIIGRNLKYPSKECTRYVDPPVILVGCIISAEGKLVGKKIIKGFPDDKECNANKNALDVVDHLTHWTPGQCEGKNVSALFIFPIRHEWSGE
jgi:hypothetical protein